jgi:glycosyltransferase involved in cell wall biosynthesis
MKILQVNAVPYGSTGGIMFSLADIMEKKGHEVLCTTGFTWKGSKRPDYVVTSNIFEKTLHTYLARLTGRIGCFSILPTWRLLRRLRKWKPDVIHLHNLHGWFINLPMLFSYIKKHDIPVVWTLHDCWSLTGQCTYFTMAGCDKWKTGCHHCSQTNRYPNTYFDHSKAMWRNKKKWFTGVKNMTIVTPSQWLGELVKQSYLKEYPVQVIPNGIDLNVFRPTGEKNGDGKFTLLGVAYEWDARKGLDVFIELARRLPERFRIIMVGTDDAVDAKLPPNITSIHRTQNQQELAALYAQADLLVNPTREDNYPTVNMEALACGTPVLTFRTGGSPESVNEDCGMVIPCDDVDAMEAAILRLERHPLNPEDCVCQAQDFDKMKRFAQYCSLYEKIYHE